MTAGGWILMIVAWGSILGLTIWCIVRVLTSEPLDDDGVPPVPPTT